MKMVGRYVFSVCSCILDDLHKKGIDYVTLPVVSFLTIILMCEKLTHIVSVYIMVKRVYTVKNMRSSY